MLSPQIRGGAIWWMRTKAKGRHVVVCRLNCVIYVWAPWGRDACHLGCYINPRTFYLYLLTLVTNIHCAPPATATSFNQEPSGELVTVHSLSPHLEHGITYRQNWNSCGRRQQHSGAIWSLFFSAPRTDYVMHLRADCRRRTTNCVVTVTATVTEWRERLRRLCVRLPVWSDEGIRRELVEHLPEWWGRRCEAAKSWRRTWKWRSSAAEWMSAGDDSHVWCNLLSTYWTSYCRWRTRQSATRQPLATNLVYTYTG